MEPYHGIIELVNEDLGYHINFGIDKATINRGGEDANHDIQIHPCYGQAELAVKGDSNFRTLMIARCYGNQAALGIHTRSDIKTVP